MKSQIRKESLARRAAIPEADRHIKNAYIETAVLSLPELETAQNIALYVDYRHEVATRSLYAALKSLGKTVAFPIAHFDTGLLTFIAVESLSDLHQTDKKLWEPQWDPDSIITVSELDIIFVPGAAFSKTGFRMGYGGGFYDRLLASKKNSTPAIGLAFTEQIVETLPLEDHDQPLNAVITDSGILRFQ